MSYGGREWTDEEFGGFSQTGQAKPHISIAKDGWRVWQSWGNAGMAVCGRTVPEAWENFSVAKRERGR